MKKTDPKDTNRLRRHNRVRARVVGSTARPRLCVYKSNRYLHAQVIDDSTAHTLAAGSTQEWPGVKKMDAATKLGVELAKRAKEAGVSAVVFDRGGFRYTGRVAALADAARTGGLVL